MVNGTLYFYATDGAYGQELWKSDGTAAGTVMVKDITIGSSGTGVSNFVAMAGKLYFVASDVTGSRLWQSDGTSAGTTKVSTTVTVDPSSGLMTMNGLLYFKASDVNGSELWRSDGTAVGTFRITNMPLFNASPYNLTNVSGTLFFVASDSATGTELWKTDGTLAGTSFVKDILPGTSPSSPRSLTNVGGQTVFRGRRWHFWL